MCVLIEKRYKKKTVYRTQAMKITIYFNDYFSYLACVGLLVVTAVCPPIIRTESASQNTFSIIKKKIPQF